MTTLSEETPAQPEVSRNDDCLNFPQRQIPSSRILIAHIGVEDELKSIDGHIVFSKLLDFANWRSINGAELIFPMCVFGWVISEFYAGFGGL